MTIRKLEHVGVFVEDMDASIRFYTQLLGMEIIERVSLGDEELVFIAFPDSPGSVIELISGRTSSLAEVGVVHHIAFTVDNIDAQVTRLKQAGVQFMSPVPETLQNGKRFIFFYGPNQEHLELFQPA